MAKKEKQVEVLTCFSKISTTTALTSFVIMYFIKKFDNYWDT